MKVFLRNILFVLVATFLYTSCEKEPANPKGPDNDPGEIGNYSMGWIASKEDVESVPYAPYFGFGTDNLPTRHDLTEYFPPIGDQGAYGTCVAWAVGYNVKTAVSAMDRNLSPQDLADPKNQFSPKDLFTSIPDAEKGGDCDGTNFEPALGQLQSRGIARMSTVPYTNMGGCEQRNLQNSWTQDAANHKIEYWRKIDPTVNSIKNNISKNIPVVLGARLADNFMSWNSDAVLTSNTTFDNVGIHAYHAMAIVGYDDSKGPGGAFRVVNSWGDHWGDRGFIWVDYQFLLNEFCDLNGQKPLYIVANQDGELPDDPPDEIQPQRSGVDLATWIFGDESTYSSSGNLRERQVYMNIYNLGQSPAKSEDNWSVYYIYYNAFDINDYGVIFHDEFTSSIARNTYECSSLDHCRFNIDIPSGSDFAAEAFDDYGIFRTYNLPNLNGLYYLVLIADGDDVYQEEDEMNNYFYTSMYPIQFQDGFAMAQEGSAGSAYEFENEQEPTLRNLRSNDRNSAVTPKAPNTYTAKEIRTFMKHEKSTGRLERKVRNIPVENRDEVFRASSSN